MKEYQNISGYFCCLDSSQAEVAKVFKKFKFDAAKFTFINSIEHDGKNVPCQGIKISGKINVKYTSKFIIKLFCKLLNIKEERTVYKLSLETEKELG